MKTIAKSDRLVANIDGAAFSPWINTDGTDSGTSTLQLNGDRQTGTGFFLYKMAPGSASEAHEHNGHEEFFVISGDLIDNDGTTYRAGDMVLLKSGTQHSSRTENGCLLAVYIPDMETNL